VLWSYLFNRAVALTLTPPTTPCTMRIHGDESSSGFTADGLTVMWTAPTALVVEPDHLVVLVYHANGQQATDSAAVPTEDEMHSVDEQSTADDDIAAVCDNNLYFFKVDSSEST